MDSIDSNSVTLRFDRGTILCEGLARDTVLPALCPLTWDLRVARFRGKAYAREQVRAVLSGMGFDVSDDDKSVGPFAGEPLRVARFREVPLRDYQHAGYEAWRLGTSRGTIVLPTGAGKTRLAIAAMKECEVPTLVLVPTRVLLHQWREAIGAFYEGFVGALGDGQRLLQGVTCATYDSARRWMPQLGNRFGLLVVDEAHHFGSGAWDEALEMCAAAQRLALTATPPRGAAWFGLAELVGPVRFELHVGDLAGEFLADLEVVEWMVELRDDERVEYERMRAVFLAVWKRFVATMPQGTWQDFVRACRPSATGRDALRAWHRARKIASWTEGKSDALGLLLSRHEHARVLIFTHDKNAAYEIAREHWIMPITSDISRREREWALAAFRSGQIHALVAARVLNEGVDVPDADVGIVVGSSHGVREYVQRVGRVLRPRVGKRAIVYELVSADTTEVGDAHRRRNALGANGARAVRHH